MNTTKDRPLLEEVLRIKAELAGLLARLVDTEVEVRADDNDEDGPHNLMHHLEGLQDEAIRMVVKVSRVMDAVERSGVGGDQVDMETPA